MRVDLSDSGCVNARRTKEEKQGGKRNERRKREGRADRNSPIGP